MASLAVANTYDRVGIREDLTDAIYNISPTDTPFVSMIGTTKAYQTKHEWQTDTLASPGNNIVEQGRVAPGTAAAATTRLYNECQINAKDVSVSGTDAVVNSAGRKSEMAYQLAKRGAEVKTDMEWACINTPNIRVTGASGTAAEISSLHTWMSNGSFGAGAAATGDGSDLPTTSTDRAFTEPFLIDAIQKAWLDGGKPNVIMLSAYNKALLGEFVGRSAAASINTDAHTKKIMNAVDIYVSDYGDLSVVPNRIVPGASTAVNGTNGHVWVLDPKTWAIAMLRPFKTFDLAVTGDATSKELLVEWTLEAKSPTGNAMVGDLSS